MEIESIRRLGTIVICMNLAFTLDCFGEDRLPFRYFDFSDELVHALEIKETSGIDKAAMALNESVIIPNSQLYKQLTGGFGSNQLIDYLTGQAPPASRIADVADGGSKECILNYWNGFITLFPDLRGDSVAVYLLPSLGRFEAQSRPSSSGYSLLFGIDEIAKRDGAEIGSVLFHHELFHIYHYQSNSYVKNGALSFFESGELPKIYELLWVEGLATYISRGLNPQASDEEIYLSESLEAQTESQLPFLFKKLSETLTSNSFEDISGFFYFPSEDERIPKDCGYLIGEQIVIEAAKRHPLEYLVSARGEAILEEVQIGIENLRRKAGN